MKKRTFIFIKTIYGADGKPKEKYIAGMTTSELFPSDAISKGGKFEGCRAVEIKENCHINLI